MKKLVKFLVSLKIFDPDSTLSLSNLAFMVILFRIATAPTLPWVETITFMTILLNHNAKKYFNKAKTDQAEATQSKITSLEEAIKQVKNMMALKK